MNASDLPAANDQSNEGMPSQTIRTIASFVLFVHLFALLVAACSTPRDGMASALQVRLRRVPLLERYLQLIWMDLPYDYFHTYGPDVAVFSSPHQIEVELKHADGRSEQVSLPDRKSPASQARLQNLANNLARYVGDRSRESVWPLIIGGQLIRQTGAQSATFRLRRQVPRTLAQANSKDLRESDPRDARYSHMVYAAVVQIPEGETNPVISKIESIGDSAPVARPAASAAPPRAKPPAAGPQAPRPVYPTTGRSS